MTCVRPSQVSNRLTLLSDLSRLPSTVDVKLKVTYVVSL